MKYIIAKFLEEDHFFLFPEDVNHSIIFANLYDIDPERKFVSAGKLYLEKSDYDEGKRSICISPGSMTLDFLPKTVEEYSKHSALVLGFIRNGFTLYSRGPRQFYHSSSPEAPYAFELRKNQVDVKIEITDEAPGCAPLAVIEMKNVSDREPRIDLYFDQAFRRI